ncbi:hypothetical protein MRX96_000073 [Rhipicephalus microplus]
MEEANHNEATQRSSSPNPVLVCRPRSTCVHHSGYRHGSPTAATISVDAVCGRAQGAHLAPNIYAAGG